MLTPIPIRTANQAETLRTIRNACRQTLGDPREITPEEQADWWSRASTGGFAGWLFADVRGVLGAGHWSLRDNYVWYATVMVLPRYQGEGIGTAIYRFLARCHRRSAALARIAADNPASRIAAGRAGWRALETDSELWEPPA